MSMDEDAVSHNQEMVMRYGKAMEMKKAGDLKAVEELLLPSVSPPSIYHGHYRELFINWRKMIKQHLSEGMNADALSLLKKMFILDREMLAAMKDYWSAVQGKRLTEDYFSTYSKINKSDIKMIHNLSQMLGDKEGLDIGRIYLHQ
ncbi:hypothetical protein [Escherichia coli]|uniref:hypothetical protein n=1 Tax=Escherichia coli TaxID=562 RepID=UPI00101F917B|nr:hypothetical protein [Escherichia coli]EFE7739090.1 hypothetical protein [Escherichia coli]EFL9697143.1 hypothetical protein [Escherichia coli]EGI4656023.1 hypothetical protein [Escherichia coli]EHX1544973.1 hypothetical protein [Escherichia coli]EIO6538169.1 hypothetical protein [Escherichia coli]